MICTLQGFGLLFFFLHCADIVYNGNGGNYSPILYLPAPMVAAQAAMVTKCIQWGQRSNNRPLCDKGINVAIPYIAATCFFGFAVEQVQNWGDPCLISLAGEGMRIWRQSLILSPSPSHSHPIFPTPSPSQNTSSILPRTPPQPDLPLCCSVVMWSLPRALGGMQPLVQHGFALSSCPCRSRSECCKYALRHIWKVLVEGWGWPNTNGPCILLYTLCFYSCIILRAVLKQTNKKHHSTFSYSSSCLSLRWDLNPIVFLACSLHVYLVHYTSTHLDCTCLFLFFLQEHS